MEVVDASCTGKPLMQGCSSNGEIFFMHEASDRADAVDALLRSGHRDNCTL
jgi:hypothetical protein